MLCAALWTNPLPCRIACDWPGWHLHTCRTGTYLCGDGCIYAPVHITDERVHKSAQCVMTPRQVQAWQNVLQNLAEHVTKTDDFTFQIYGQEVYKWTPDAQSHAERFRMEWANICVPRIWRVCPYAANSVTYGLFWPAINEFDTCVGACLQSAEHVAFLESDNWSLAWFVEIANAEWWVSNAGTRAALVQRQTAPGAYVNVTQEPTLWRRVAQHACNAVRVLHAQHLKCE